MTQLCCYRVWDGSLQKFRRTVLFLSAVELAVVSAVIVFVGISLYKVSFVDPLPDPTNEQIQNFNNSQENETHVQVAAICDDADVDGGCTNSTGHDLSSAANETMRATLFPSTPYFQVVGIRIAKSIQLLLFTGQLLVTIILVRGLLWTNTHSMRTWLIVTEILTTVVLIVLVLYLFGDFQADNVIILLCYLVYQFIMIRTVVRFIRRVEIELTQFGSIVEF